MDLGLVRGTRVTCVTRSPAGDPGAYLIRGALIALRHSHPELQARSPFSVYSAEPGSRLFAYKRGDLLCALNPGVEALALPLDSAYRILFCQGTAEIQNQVLAIQGFAVLEPAAGA